jgi:hypothetical protein
LEVDPYRESPPVNLTVVTSKGVELEVDPYRESPPVNLTVVTSKGVELEVELVLGFLLRSHLQKCEFPNRAESLIPVFT